MTSVARKDTEATQLPPHKPAYPTQQKLHHDLRRKFRQKNISISHNSTYHRAIHGYCIANFPAPISLLPLTR